MTLDIILVAPRTPSPRAGNQRSIDRLVQGLCSRGHRVTTVVAGDSRALDAALHDRTPDIVHVYHAIHGAIGRWPLPRTTARVVTFAGSDLPGIPLAQDFVNTIATEVALADAATAALTDQARSIEVAWPNLSGRVRVVPKGVVRPMGEFDLRARTGLRSSECIALLPAGIRPVKRTMEAIEWFGDVVAIEPSARLVLLGDVVDAEYAAGVRVRLARTPYAIWLGPIPPESMAGAIRAADVVLNTSRWEGQSNALLESLSLGARVVASDVPGNHEWLSGRGLVALFRTREEFVARIFEALAGSPEVQAMAERGRQFVLQHHRVEQEIDALLELYRWAIEHRRRAIIESSESGSASQSDSTAGA